ncbi:phospholipid/cholesterol/gamma-HCH transport system substrate-binding protein [Oryzisolibacter propanilivorax]|uniref:Phospholipid/cholesterol/gamma-HCH transport system substrate-binding protein n=1 Tax=Oryzisolibacter propanilivorax TaxID=1527607 RepID=A0A1G9QSQ7_9BURK|nr:MlaD family protein [Oryzisolibacter propanilivorax]SDM13870.1 phospholipid/cholesterol/gamma-HCH transport system substrate-binding protein [Oryzisolibacter propanilivorax]
MENKSHALAAGAFVLVVAALLTGLALWLTRDQTAYNLYELSSKDSVSGLQPQAAVRYKGVAVGKVTSIGFDPQASGNVLIRIAVDRAAPISPTTFATLGYQGVTGLAHIQLDDAKKPLPQPAPGASGLPRLPLKSSPLSQLAEQGPAILGQVQEVTKRINELLGEDNQQRFATALEQLGQAAGSVNQLAQRLERTVDTRLDPALAVVPQVAQDARQTLAALRQAGDSAGRAAEDIGATVRGLSAEGGPIQEIAAGSKSLAAAADRFGRVTLPRLNHAADETARAARRLGRTASGISDNPQSLLYGPGEAAAGPGEPGFAPPPARP